MKCYELDTKLTFGRFENKTIEEILFLEPGYINWCIINLDHFYIAEYVIDDIKEIKSDFILSEEEIQVLEKKGYVYDKIHEMPDDSDNDWVNETQDFDDWLRDEFGDEAGTAYWNLD